MTEGKLVYIASLLCRGCGRECDVCESSLPVCGGTGVYRVLNVLKGVAEIEMLCLNSRENFEENKSFLRKRAEEERNPVVRRLLERDQNFLDRIQVQMATAREFLIIIRLHNEKGTEVFSYLDRIEKSLKEQGFSASRAGAGTLSGSWLCITSRT